MIHLVSLAEFIRSGTFGPIRIGMSAESARDLLGGPGSIGRGQPDTEIWQYAGGRVEVTLMHGALVLIAWYPWKGHELSDGVRIVDDLPPDTRNSAARFIEWLNEQHVRYEVFGAPEI